VPRDVFEVRVGAQELGLDLETRLGDDAVHCARHSERLPSQGTEQASRSDAAVHGWMDQRQGDEDATSTLESCVGPEFLKGGRLSWSAAREGNQSRNIEAHRAREREAGGQAIPSMKSDRRSKSCSR